MRVVGAARNFAYGAAAGASGAFRARVHHASVAPLAGSGEHLKIAFFFREAPRGERRAKRAVVTEGGDPGAEDEGGALAQRRRLVAGELKAYSLEAQHAMQHGPRLA
jgi:hypothetical protein